MKKIIVVFLLLFVVLFACKNKSCSAEKKPQKSIMYQPSELALLMQQMHAQQLAWKQLIEQDSFSIAFPKDFMGIYTLQPTDSTLEIRSDEFIQLSDAYISAVEKLIKAKKNKKQAKLYNTTVDACINCHAIYCQGPIDKIKKLYIAGN